MGAPSLNAIINYPRLLSYDPNATYGNRDSTLFESSKVSPMVGPYMFTNYVFYNIYMYKILVYNKKGSAFLS